MNRRMWLGAAAVAGSVVISSCASISVSALPQPGNAYRDGYDLIMEFDNVLNLPERAKVVLDGTTVGVVTKVAITGRRVDVTSRIAPDVRVPSDIHAELQQATVLGDTYVALERPPAGHPIAPALGPGGRIPLTHTTSPPQVEDTIASLANFVTSGSIQRIQNTIIGINRVQPPEEGAVHKIASQVAADLSGLSDNMDLVDQYLNGVSGTIEVLHNRLPDFEAMFSPKGITGFHRMLRITQYIGTILPSLGSIYSNGYWLAPLIDTLADAFGALQHSKQAFEGEEYRAWQRLLTNFFLPQDKYPAINITSIVGPDGRELSGKVQDVLRIIGAAP